MGEMVEREIQAYSPDLVIVTGDMTSWSTRREYREAAKWLRGIESPLLVVPGNHDIFWWNPFIQIFDSHCNFNRYIQHLTQPIFKRKKLTILGVDSTARFLFGMGYVSGSERSRLKAQLERIPMDHYIIVAFHHNMLPVPGTGMNTTALFNYRKMLNILQTYRVDMVLNGHRHAFHIQLIDELERDKLKMKATDSFHPQIIVTCNSTTSSRYRGNIRENGYNVIQIMPEHVEIHQQIFDPTENIFVTRRSDRFKNLKIQ
ncbi:MAG: hypothetical protein B6244_09385 [Candidatus Cloacimonetes bacterium 4572_55]|nr:MAG: hypothetical protein B6244_09385 [Candidatus Cloacimonetes bacterium 4572_55]